MAHHCLLSDLSRRPYPRRRERVWEGRRPDSKGLVEGEKGGNGSQRDGDPP